ncbi:MAG: YicC/YloC family endoribonuclease [Deltaproteobacteria bacterium]|nr:YicC/YloC family endoribonuclease [Deltaproteobacteria bacterium]
MKSMTGFGLKKGSVKGTLFSVEAKSVNHRYAEVNVRLPHSYLFLEKEVVGLIRRIFSRGKIDLFAREESTLPELPFDSKNTRRLVGLLRKMKKDFGLKGEITLDNLLACREFFSKNNRQPSTAEVRSFLTTVKGALENLKRMREREGMMIDRWLCKRLSFLGKLVVTMEKESHRAVQEYKKRYRGQERAAEGTAIFADRTDITEEMTRLKSHLEQFKKSLGSHEPIGRKLDFLTQEMVREVNTVGSKCQSTRLSEGVITFKSELEKIREQIQNVE